MGWKNWYYQAQEISQIETEESQIDTEIGMLSLQSKGKGNSTKMIVYAALNRWFKE
jgi:hypothetical protein